MTTHAIQRKTVAQAITIKGIGLFTDTPASATIEPTAPGLGIRFVHNNTTIDANISMLARSPIAAFANIPPRHTCLALGTDRAVTTEHLLAALAGLRITDATITLGTSGELPIGDGSAKLFVDAINAVGTTDLAGTITPIVLTEVITVYAGGATITAEPADETSYTYIFEPGDDSPLNNQAASWNNSPKSFVTDIASARTFSMLHEAEQLQSLGLFTSFSTEDLLVLDAAGAPINNEFRYDNEPARHKVLDLIGDLALVGVPFSAKITATRSGHALNHELAKRLFSLVT